MALGIPHALLGDQVRHARNTAAMLDGELLDVARSETGRVDLVYAEPPVRLSGGFFTENHAFRLAGAPEPWDGPLVVRRFPKEAPADLPRREAVVQRVLAAQGYPAPAVVWFDEAAHLCERHAFVMRRLPGRAMVGGIRLRELMTSAPTLLRRLVDTTAFAQAWLHCLDAAPLVDGLAGTPTGVERWYERLEAFDDLAPAHAWLVAHRPRETSHPVVCHGDLWAANILTEGDRLTGVLDYTVATVAEPALDVGFTAMSFALAPVDAPAAIQRVVAHVAGRVGRRYVAAYVRETGADLRNQPYYEALRCASELTNVVSFRRARAAGEPHDAPRPTWDAVSDRMVEYFRERTGVTLRLPPPVGRDCARGR
jgi:aminoglycoside phosphotransferase (APT) family kinase protein